MIDLDTVAARFMAAREASQAASETGLDRSKLQTLLDSWTDVASLHDELKDARRLATGARVALTGILSNAAIDSTVYGLAHRALNPDSPQCAEMVWPERWAEHQVQCPSWAVETGPDGVPRCGIHTKAFERSQAIEEAKKRGERWELVGWTYETHRQSSGGSIYKSPRMTFHFDNEIEAREAEAEAKRTAQPGEVVYARLSTKPVDVHPERSGTTLGGQTSNADVLGEDHDIRSQLDGFSSISLTDFRVDGKHSVNVKAGDGQVVVTCNDCDFEWKGDRL